MLVDVAKKKADPLTKMRIPTRRAVLQKLMEIRGERIKSWRRVVLVVRRDGEVG